jgi:hypothetical protein
MRIKKNREARNQIQAKKAKRDAFGWLARQGAWEIQLDNFHRVNMGGNSGHSKSASRPAA